MKLFKKAAGTGLAIAFMASGAFAQSLKDAQTAIDAEQYAKAKSILRTLVENQPKKGVNYFYLGDVYLITDYPDSAKTIFQQGLEAEPKYNLNKVGIGAAELAQGNASEADAQFAQATEKLKRKDYLENLYIGRAYMNPNLEKPDYQKALTYLEKAKEANQKDALIFSSLGDAYFGLKDNSNAYTNYRDAYDMDNSFTRARVQQTVITKQAKAFEEAIEDLKTITQEHPDYAPAYRELAETYYLYANNATKSEDYESRIQEALGQYKKYMDLTDYSLDSRMRYADFLILAKDYKAVEEQANEMAKIDDVNPRILRYLGYAAYENDNYEASQNALTEFIGKVEPTRIIPRDYYFLGLAQVKQAQPSGDTTLLASGVANLSKGVEQDSTLAEDLSAIAKESFDTKDYASAGALFKAASQAEGSKTINYDLFYWGFSQYFNYAMKQQAGEEPSKELLNEAEIAFARVNEVTPEMPEAYLFRARVNGILDDAENPQGLAVPHYEGYIKAVEAKGEETVQKSARNLAEAYNVMAADLVNKEDYAGARELLHKTLDLDPENAYANQTLEQLAPDPATARQ